MKSKVLDNILEDISEDSEINIRYYYRNSVGKNGIIAVPYDKFKKLIEELNKGD